MLFKDQDQRVVLCPSPLVYNLLNNCLDVGTGCWAAIGRSPLPLLAYRSPQIRRIPIDCRRRPTSSINIVGGLGERPRIGGQFAPQLMLWLIYGGASYEYAHPRTINSGTDWHANCCPAIAAMFCSCIYNVVGANYVDRIDRCLPGIIRTHAHLLVNRYVDLDGIVCGLKPRHRDAMFDKQVRPGPPQSERPQQFIRVLVRDGSTTGTR